MTPETRPPGDSRSPATRIRRLRSLLLRHLPLLVLVAILLIATIVLGGRLLEPTPARGPATPARYGEAGITERVRPPTGIRIEQGPYAGFSRSGSPVLLDAWAPLHLVVTNHTTRTLSGTLTYRIDDSAPGGQGSTAWRQAVVLGGHGSTKHFVQPVYLPSSSDMSGGWGVEARLSTTTHGTVLREFVPLQHLQRRIPLKVAGGALARQQLAILLGDLPHYRIPPFDVRSTPARRIQTVRASLPELPRSWQSYGGVGAVIWDGEPLGKLDALPAAALRDYVRGGGHLVVCVGDRGALLSDSALSPLLPCGIGPSGAYDLAPRLNPEARDAPLARLARLHPRRGTWSHRLEDETGRWGWAPVADTTGDTDDAGPPLAIRGDYGAGCVTVLAFSLEDPALDAVGPSAWESWLLGTFSPTLTPLLETADRTLRTRGHEALLRLSRRRIPSRGAVALLLGLYWLAGVPGLFALSRVSGRAVLAWSLSPLLAITVFAGSYYAYFGNADRGISITDLSFARLDAEGRGHALSLSLLYNPGYAIPDITFGNETAVAMRLPAGTTRTGGVDGDLEIRTEGGRYRIEDFRIPWNSQRVLASQRLLRLGAGLALRLEGYVPDPTGESSFRKCRIENRMGEVLRQAVLLAGSRAWLLGDLPPGTTLAPGSPAGSARPETALGALARAEGLPPGLVREGAAMLLGREERVALIGVLRTSPVAWRLDGAPATSTGWTLVALPCAYPAPSADLPPADEETDRQFLPAPGNTFPSGRGRRR